MAKFCSQCGKPLQEGEVCTCQQQAAGSGVAPQSGQTPLQMPPQGGPGGYGQTPLQGGPQGPGQTPPQGGPNGYSQVPPQGGPGGYGQIPPQGGPGGYSQIPPQGGPGGYSQIPPQGGPSGYGQGQPYGYGQVPPQGGPGGYGQPYGGPQVPRQPGAAGIYMKGLWGTIVDAYKKPAETLSNMVEAGKTPVVLGICGIQCILFSFIFLFFGFKMNSAASRLSGGMVSVKVVSTPTLFFVTLIGGACILACWGAVAMAFGRGKKPMNYMQGLGVAAAKALAQMPFTVLTALIVLIFPIVSRYDINTIPMLVALMAYTLGNLLAYFFIPAGMDGFLTEEKNKRVWQLFFLFLVNAIVTAILAFIFSLILGGSIGNFL